MSAYSVSEKAASPDREERVEMAERLRGTDTIAGLTLPDVRRAVARARRRVGTKETERASRFYTMGPAVAELCLRLLFWEGKGQDERGIHKSFAELKAETGETERRLQTARKVAEEEGLLTATVGFRPNAERQRTLWWRLNLWRLHEVVFKGALEETKIKLEAGGRPRDMEKVRARRDALEAALYDLRLGFLDDDGGPDDEGPEPAEDDDIPREGVGTSCYDGNSNLYALQECTQVGFEEMSALALTKKSAPRLSLPVSGHKTKKLGTLTDEEAEERWEQLVAGSPHGRRLTTLAEILAEKNKTGDVSIRKVWRQLGEKFIKWQARLDYSEDAWDYGLDAAIDHEAPSIAYVRKAAERCCDRDPPRHGHRGSGRERSLRPKGGLGLDYDE